LDIVNGPNGSCSCLNIDFVWVEIEENGRRKRIRLVGWTRRWSSSI